MSRLTSPKWPRNTLSTCDFVSFTSAWRPQSYKNLSLAPDFFLFFYFLTWVKKMSVPDLEFAGCAEWVVRIVVQFTMTPTLFWDIRNLFWYENISVSKANIQRNTESRWAREDSLIFGSSLFSTPRTTTSQWTCSSILSASGTSVSVHVHFHDLW